MRSLLRHLEEWFEEYVNTEIAQILRREVLVEQANIRGWSGTIAMPLLATANNWFLYCCLPCLVCIMAA